MSVAAQMTSHMSSAYSGLSALIQAATSQLAHLIDHDHDHVDDHVPDRSHLTSPTLEGGYASTASSDLDLRESSSPKASQTPLIVPEQDTAITTNRPLTFPEELMTLLLNPRNEDVITFLPDGKYFAIRRKEFTENFLQDHFRLTSFEEFLETIRGWGFARINCDKNVEEDDHNHTYGDSSTGENGCASGNELAGNAVTHHSSARAAIHVFRHPHFKKDQQVDMNKIKFERKAGGLSQVQQMASDAAAGMISISSETPNRVLPTIPSTPRVSENNSMSDESTSSFFNPKRRLSPTHLDRDTADRHDPKEQRTLSNEQYRRTSTTSDTSHKVAPPILTTITSPHDSNDLPPRVARRRSSIELRGKALAITTSKLNLQSGEGPEEDDDEDDCDGTDETSTANNRNGPTGVVATASSGSCTGAVNAIQRAHRKHERKLSSAPLVDGAVEAATHTIVTDAIETLLFDELHTRETYLKHEKELSVSSLPGVVPISKQLFASKNPADSRPPALETAATAAASNGDGNGHSKGKSSTNCKPKATTASNTGSGRTRGTRSQKKEMSASTPLQVDDDIILAPPAIDVALTPRTVTMDESRSLASPARLEAAEALMEQSQMVDNVTRSAASRSEF